MNKPTEVSEVSNKVPKIENRNIKTPTFIEIQDTYKSNINKAKTNKFSFGTVIVIEIPNPFKLNIQNKRTELHGKTLREYVKRDKFDETNYCIIHNNKEVLKREDQERIIVKENDTIIYFPYQEVTGIIALANAIMVPLSTGALTAAMGYAIVGVSYALATVIVIGGMMLVSSWLAPDAPEGMDSSNMSESSTYSWDGISTNGDINSMLPVLYGTHVLGGTSINTYQHYEESDNWLALQIGLCYGEIEPITEDDIYINGNEFTNYITNVEEGTFQYREGTLEQSIMDGFDDTSFNNADMAIELPTNEEILFTSNSDNIDKFKIHFSCPQGLYVLNTKKGKQGAITLEYQVAYRKVGETVWNYITQNTYQKQYSLYNTLTKEWSSWVVYNANNFDDSVYETSESYYQSKGLIKYREAIIGTTDTISKTYNTKNEIKFTQQVSGLELGQYEFKVLKLTRENTINSSDRYRYSTKFDIAYLEEINTTDINYGGIALLGLDVKATSSLSNSQPNITTKVTRKDLKIYTSDDYLSYITVRSNNPAWICYDILTNPFYGANEKPSNLDYNKFEAWASFCDLEDVDSLDDLIALGHPTQLNFNGVFDAMSTPWDACQTVAKLGRGQILLRGSTYTCVWDAIQPITNMFNTGDIKKETFQVSYTPKNDLATELEIQYSDEGIRNELNVVTIVDSELNDTKKYPNTSSVTAQGITTQAEAIVYGRYMLATTKYQRRTVTWESDIKGVTCEVGDVVAIQNDIPLWGSGGRIQDVNIESVVLEEPVDLSSDKEYILKIQSQDGTFTDYIIEQTSLSETYTIPLVGEFDIKVNDSYIFGENNNSHLLVKLTDVKRENKTLTTKFTGTDYNPSILDFYFNNDWLNPLTPSFADANEILTFDITEEITTATTGKVSINLGFTWTAINTGTYNIYAIPDFYVDEDIPDAFSEELDNIEANRIYLAKDVTGNSYIAKEVGLEEDKYRVFIQEVNNLGNIREVLYTVNGKVSPPPDINQVSWEESGSEFSFFVNYTDKPYDFKQYNLYYNNVLYDSYTSNFFKTNTILGLEKKTFKIEAEDTSGNKSNLYTLEVQATRPPKADFFYSELLSDKSLKFTFETSNKPDDFEGYYIRYNRGVNYDWDSGKSLFDGVILSSPFISKAYFSKGTYTFLLKTVNSAGDVSTEASIVTTNLGEALVENLVFQKEFNPIFEGTITNGIIQNDILSALETEEEYWDKDTLEYWGLDTSPYWGIDSDNHWSNTNIAFWGVDKSMPFWVVENSLPLTYESSFVSDGSGFLKVNYEGQGSPKIFVRQRDNVTFWEDNIEAFWEEDSDIFWDIADYIPYNEEIQITPNADYDIKVFFESVSGYLPSITELSVIVDAKDIFETFEDISIPITGYSISPIKDFDVIKVVNVTIQDDGGNAREVRVDKSGSPFEVYVYDENNNLTSGVVDIIIQGY